MAIARGQAADDTARQLMVAEELDDDFFIQLAPRPPERRFQIAHRHVDARRKRAVAQELRVDDAQIAVTRAAGRLAQILELEHSGHFLEQAPRWARVSMPRLLRSGQRRPCAWGGGDGRRRARWCGARSARTAAPLRAWGAAHGLAAAPIRATMRCHWRCRRRWMRAQHR